MPEIIRIVLPSPMPNDVVDMYLVLDDPLTLIDAGYNNAVTRERLGQTLASRGLSLSHIRRVIVTHTHPDHVGFAAAVQVASGATVLLHRREWDKIQQGTADNAAILYWAGVPTAQLPSVRTTAPAVVYPPAVEFISDGDIIPFEHWQLRVAHTPGHCSGLVCLHAAGEEILFSSDHLVPDFAPALLVEADESSPTGRTESYNQYFASLRRLSTLAVRHVCPGHGEPFAAYHAAIERLYRGHARKLERLKGLLAGQPQTAYDFVRRLNPDMQGSIVFFACGDTISHLDKLVELGDAVVEDRDGVLYYQQQQ